MRDFRLRIRWQLTHVGHGAYVANCEGEVAFLRAPIYEHLIPLVDGIRTTQTISELLRGRYNESSIRRALKDLENRGVVSEHEIHPAAPRNATAEVLAIGQKRGHQVASTLAAFGIALQTGGSLRIVITEDYLDPALDDLNREAIQRRSPWIIGRPSGRFHWIGPLFVPGRTACWRCLAQSLRSNVFGAKGVETTPASVAFTETMIAVGAAKWIWTGVNADFEGRLQTLDPVSQSARAHSVSRFPQCPVCAPLWTGSQDPSALIGRKKSTSSVLLRHHSELTGIFSRLEHVPTAPGIYIHQALVNRVVHTDYAGATMVLPREAVCGKALDRDRSRTGCMAEAIERYSVHFHGDESRVRARYQDLAPNAVNLKTLRPGRMRQEDTEAEWVAARCLTNGSERFVPAEYCYLGYRQSEYGSNSNGCAAGNTFEEAVLRGFLELVERDAVALWWYNRARRPAIPLPSGAPARYIHSRNRRVHVLDLTTDFGIPVAAAITALADGTDVVIGSAAALTITEAIERALLEAVVLLERPRRNVFLGHQSYLAPLDEMRAPRHPRIPQRTTKEQLAWCLEKAKQLALEAIAVDMTRPEVGFPVARVIVPGLCHWKPGFAPGRLFDAPVVLGWRRTKLRARDLNPVPFYP